MRGSCTLKPTLNIKPEVQLYCNIFWTKGPIKQKITLIFRTILLLISIAIFLITSITNDNIYNIYLSLLYAIYLSTIIYQTIYSFNKYAYSICHIILPFCVSSSISSSIMATTSFSAYILLIMIISEFIFSLFQFHYFYGLRTIVIFTTINIIISLITNESIIDPNSVFMLNIIIHLIITFLKNIWNMKWFNRTNIVYYDLSKYIIEDRNEDEILSDMKDVEHCTLTFGSCIDQRQKRIPSLRSMFREYPNVVIMVGDNIYADLKPPTLTKCIYFREQHPLFSEYEQLLNHIDFQNNSQVDEKLIEDDEQEIVYHCTWDDHDYGENNAENDYGPKHESKKAFLKFLGELNARMKNELEIIADDENRGIFYASDYYQMLGNERLWLKIIMLDARFHRIEDSDLFGEEQWKWIEECFPVSNGSESGDVPDWYIVCCGSPIMNEGLNGRKTVNMQSRERLLAILERSGKLKRTLILSGDLHYSVWHKYRDMYEFTVSSFTHSRSFYECNCCLSIKNIDDYDIKMEEKSVVCKKDAYGMLKFTKDEWVFCVKDAYGYGYLDVSKQSRVNG